MILVHAKTNLFLWLKIKYHASKYHEPQECSTKLETLLIIRLNTDNSPLAQHAQLLVSIPGETVNDIMLQHLYEFLTLQC